MPVLRRPDSLPDTRALWLHRLTSSPVARLMGLVHGALLPLHGLLNAAASGEEIGQGPDIGRLTSSCISASRLLRPLQLPAVKQVA